MVQIDGVEHILLEHAQRPACADEVSDVLHLLEHHRRRGMDLAPHLALDRACRPGVLICPSLSNLLESSSSN